MSVCLSVSCLFTCNHFMILTVKFETNKQEKIRKRSWICCRYLETIFSGIFFGISLIRKTSKNCHLYVSFVYRKLEEVASYVGWQCFTESGEQASNNSISQRWAVTVGEVPTSSFYKDSFSFLSCIFQKCVVYFGFTILEAAWEISEYFIFNFLESLSHHHDTDRPRMVLTLYYIHIFHHFPIFIFRTRTEMNMGWDGRFLENRSTRLPIKYHYSSTQSSLGY